LYGENIAYLVKLSIMFVAFWIHLMLGVELLLKVLQRRDLVSPCEGGIDMEWEVWTAHFADNVVHVRRHVHVQVRLHVAKKV
jgi:hypothetical protein